MRFVREPAETEEWAQKYRILKPEMIYSSGGVLRVRGGNRVATPSPSLSVWGASSTAARGVPDGDPIKRLKNFYVFYLLQMGSPAQKSEKTECSVRCSMTDNCCSVAGPRPLSPFPSFASSNRRTWPTCNSGPEYSKSANFTQIRRSFCLHRRHIGVLWTQDDLILCPEDVGI